MSGLVYGISVLLCLTSIGIMVYLTPKKDQDDDFFGNVILNLLVSFVPVANWLSIIILLAGIVSSVNITFEGEYEND